MRYLPLILLLAMTVLSCSPDATEIVNRTLESSGSANLEGKEIRFEFRDKQYRSARDNGRFLLERTFVQDSFQVRDVITNNGFQRFLNDSLAQVVDSMAVKYSNSVNSVHYFAYLPYGLNDEAVNKELLEGVEINGTPYYKIKVWFDQEGGGTDFEDVFLYWINKNTSKVDFLAYEYHTNGGGIRFREAYNRRTIDGIDFTDYRNFKPRSKEASLYELDSLFQQDDLELLSVIELKEVLVAPCDSCL